MATEEDADTWEGALEKLSLQEKAPTADAAVGDSAKPDRCAQSPWRLLPRTIPRQGSPFEPAAHAAARCRAPMTRKRRRTSTLRSPRRWQTPHGAVQVRCGICIRSTCCSHSRWAALQAIVSAHRPHPREGIDDCICAAAVVKLEEAVEKFIGDTSRDVLEFPPNYSNYHVSGYPQRFRSHQPSGGPD